jgi:hypothetical protein
MALCPQSRDLTAALQHALRVGAVAAQLVGVAGLRSCGGLGSTEAHLSRSKLKNFAPAKFELFASPSPIHCYPILARREEGF